MELIDKFKLLEELKKCEKICEDYMLSHKDAVSQGIANAKRAMCQHIIKIINTLEVKEVNLEKELENIIKKEKAFITDDREVKYYNGDSFNHIYELEFIAKYFFELGLKAKKKEVDLDAMQRMEECPYRRVGCTMYEGKILECKGACSWVVDYPKLKELKTKKGE